MQCGAKNEAVGAPEEVVLYLPLPCISTQLNAYTFFLADPPNAMVGLAPA